MGCFGISDYYQPAPELDQWIRRRFACAIGDIVAMRERGDIFWRWERTNAM